MSERSRIKQLEWDVTYLKAQVANLRVMAEVQNQYNDLTNKRIKAANNEIERLRR